MIFLPVLHLLIFILDRDTCYYSSIYSLDLVLCSCIVRCVDIRGAERIFYELVVYLSLLPA